MRRALLALLLVVLVLGAGGAWLGWSAYTAPGPLAEARPVVVPRGGTAAIAEALEEAGVVEDGRVLLLAARATRGQGPLRAGEFLFPASAPVREVLALLREARPVQRRLTVPEGLMASQIAGLLEAAEGLEGEVPAFEEGALLPETYAYQWGESREAVVRRARSAMEEALRTLWVERDPALPLASPREVLVLASIVERETGQAGERARVASVFLNRLRRGMPLQSDPTVAYAASPGRPMERPITRADLEREHPFNTYRVRGLPPAPIAAPGREALRAVVRPESTDLLYFVADGTGGHAFSRTLEEHNRAVARWRAVERNRARGEPPDSEP